MENTILQAGLWLMAGVILVAFVARRRKRRAVR